VLRQIAWPMTKQGHRLTDDRQKTQGQKKDGQRGVKELPLRTQW